MDAALPDDVVLTAKRLCDVGVCEGDECKSSERLRNKNVGDFSIFRKEIAKVVGGDVFVQTSNENLAIASTLRFSLKYK